MGNVNFGYLSFWIITILLLYKNHFIQWWLDITCFLSIKIKRDAQKSIQSASILLLEIDALTTDLAKNLCLAGVAKLTIASNAITRVEDLGSEFFLTPESIGKPKLQYYVDRLRLLNPRGIYSPLLYLILIDSSSDSWIRGWIWLFYTESVERVSCGLLRIFKCEYYS